MQIVDPIEVSEDRNDVIRQLAALVDPGIELSTLELCHEGPSPVALAPRQMPHVGNEQGGEIERTGVELFPLSQLQAFDLLDEP